MVPLIEQGAAVPLFSWGALDADGNLIRDPTFPDLPHYGEAYELLHGEPPRGAGWESWFAFFTAGFPAQKLLVAPAETPDEIVGAYEDAVRAMRRDPEYIARKPAALGTYEQVVGPAAQRIYELATDGSAKRPRLGPDVAQGRISRESRGLNLAGKRCWPPWDPPTGGRSTDSGAPTC